MPDKRTHFVRFLTQDSCNNIIKQLNEVAGDTLHQPINSKTDFFEVKTPTGAMVFSGMRKNRGGNFIARLHREIFSEKVTT